MDVLTTLKRLADAKSAQTKAWNATQGLVTADYDILTTQVAALRRGELDGEMSVLRDLDGAEMPDIVRNQILESVKNNEQTVSSVETLSTEIFYGSDIIYVKGIPATGNNLSRAFANCYSLYAVLGVSFVNAVYASELFKNCYSLRAIKLSDGDFAKSYSVNSLFEACKSITGLTLPSGSFAVAINASQMFDGCSSLTGLTLPAGSFGAVTNVKAMFYSCRSLTGLTLPEGSFGAVTNASQMFSGCSSLTGLTLPAGSFGAVTNVKAMFYSCRSLTGLTLPEGSFGAVTNANNMFSGCSSITGLALPAGSFGAVTNASQMFSGCSSITGLALPAGSFGAVTNASFMFYSCRSLTGLTLPEGSFGAVTNANNMFDGCSSLTGLTLPAGSFGAVNDASYMFSSCKALKSVILPATFSAKSINSAFFNCSSLTNIDLHGMTRQAVNMYRLFNGCILLKSVTGLDLSGVALTVDDLLNANIGITTSGAEMSFSIVVNDLFYNCNSLSDCRLNGILYKSGVNLQLAKMLSAESLYSCVKALYDWEANEEGKTTDDEDHVLYMSAAQQQALTDYTGENGENGEDAYLEAIAKGWTILN